MTRRDIVTLVLCCALLGAAASRLVSPAAGAVRRISVEAVEIRSAPIKSGESLVQEASWTPPDDVFVVGWAPDLGAPGASPELYLRAGETTIFTAPRASLEGLKAVFLPSGTGYLVRKGEVVKLRLQINNSGPDGESRGARALIYFHPVAFR
ncbi:MAG: hypothetical protein K1Y01_08090 [Vicinamibacteria bacterium]|nr:hypothetical protein [Vicinamibacteria bacterium]